MNVRRSVYLFILYLTQAREALYTRKILVHMADD